MTSVGDYALRFRDPDFDCFDGDYRRIYEVTSALGPEGLNATKLANRIVSAVSPRIKLSLSPFA